VWLALFLSRDPFTRTAALFMAAPLAFYGLSIGPPWSAAPAVVNLLFAAALARESLRERREFGIQAAPLQAGTATE
jgi:hypothetical protein